MFRTLDANEEKTFRQYAHDHAEADNTIDVSIIHPVVRDEWARIARSDSFLDQCTCTHGAGRHESITIDRTGQVFGGGVVTVTNCLDCPPMNRDHGFVSR